MAASAVESRIFAQRSKWQPALSVAAVFAFSLLLRLAAGLILPHPRPYVGDEFSYLLGAETLAAGRVANPQHPMWRFFESPHILVHPAYASKYPPAQAVVLALGDKLLGDPAIGVFLSVALFAAAVCWALQGYVSERWALIGGIFVAVAFGPGHYWTESYWGGAVAALGAALVIGAYPRRTSAAAWIFGLGAAILLNSRPYEGGVLGACFVVLALRTWRLRALAPLLACAAITAAMMGYYNWRVTGSPLEMPYSLYQAQYGPAPTLWIAPARLSTSYGYPELRRLFEQLIRERNNVLAYPLLQRIGVLFVRLAAVLVFGVGPVAFLPIVFAAAVRRDRRVRMLCAAAAAITAALLLDVSMFLHYAAPLIGVLVVLSFVVLHRMSSLRSGAAMTRLVVAVMFASALFRTGQALAGVNVNYPARPPFRFDRDAITSRLLDDPGQHVVLVRYVPDHNVHIEWVYNAADIDRSRVVWAHDLGEDANRELRNYYAGRHFWLLQPDDPHPTLAALP